GRVSLPVKTSLNCTMPALVNSKVGSLPGTSGEDDTTWCPLDSKKERNFWRISEVFIDGKTRWNMGNRPLYRATERCAFLPLLLRHQNTKALYPQRSLAIVFPGATLTVYIMSRRRIVPAKDCRSNGTRAG